MNPYPWAAAAVNLWVTALVVVAMFGTALVVALKVRGNRHDGIDVVCAAVGTPPPDARAASTSTNMGTGMTRWRWPRHRPVAGGRGARAPERLMRAA